MRVFTFLSISLILVFSGMSALGQSRIGYVTDKRLAHPAAAQRLAGFFQEFRVDIDQGQPAAFRQEAFGNGFPHSHRGPGHQGELTVQLFQVVLPSALV